MTPLPAHRPRKRVGDSGVTLIEILVVLALIGIGAGIVSYALPSGAKARSLEQEAALLAARLNNVADRSLVAGETYRVIWQSEAYRFETWKDKAWHTATGAPLSGSHTLYRGATLSDATGAQRGSFAITPALLPPTTGIVSLRLASGVQDRTVTFDGATAQLGQQTQ